MTNKPVFLTEEGQTKVLTELRHLRNVRRPEVAERVHRAKEMESASNNAEYDDAKNEQAFIEGRITDLEGVLIDATIVHPDHFAGQVEIGSRVKLLTHDGGEEVYTIVGSAEADPAEGKISNESPVGEALLGKRAGEDIEVTVPAGVERWKLTEIS